MAYGCFNRAPFASHFKFWQRDGTTCKLFPVTIPNVMAKTCQYQKDDKYSDRGCIGCEHKKVPNEKS